MEKNTSILLDHHFENFVNKEIASGKYNSVSEVIHSALRLLETEEQKVQALRKELEIGERSNKIENFNADNFLSGFHKKHL